MSETGMLRRRDLLCGAAAIGVAGMVGLTATSANETTSDRPATGPKSLPDRGNFVIRGAYVMTMDATLGDIANGDVHVADGTIVAVGTDLNAPGATVIDGQAMIVLPGFVDTHWHTWNSLLRSMPGDTPETGYFPTRTALGKVYRSEDMYHGSRLAAAEAIYSGITSLHDWCHNVRDLDFADANIRALMETGIRARFYSGPGQGRPPTQSLAPDLERLHRDWSKYSNGGLISLGLAWRGQTSKDAEIREVTKAEFNTARALGLPISVHVSAPRGPGQIDKLGDGGFLGKDVNIVHASAATRGEMERLAAAGTSVSLTPFSELRVGYNITETGDFLDAGVTVGLGVDSTALSGNADMFGIMKVIQNIENGREKSEFQMPARRVLALATIEGARAVGMDSQVGSLTPGKRADIIMVNTRAINMGVFTNPAHMLVEAAQPSNVDTVVVDGRILKRHGQFTALDTEQIIAGAAAALAGLRERGNW